MRSRSRNAEGSSVAGHAGSASSNTFVTLPGDVDPNSVDASLSGGVLTVRVGKAYRTEPRRIEVRGS